MVYPGERRCVQMEEGKYCFHGVTGLNDYDMLMLFNQPKAFFSVIEVSLQISRSCLSARYTAAETSASTAFLFFELKFPLASTPPASGTTFLAVSTYPSAPPLLVI